MQAFINIFKDALLIFYNIEYIMKSQDDNLHLMIVDEILDVKVSAVLIKASLASHEMQIAHWSLAIDYLRNKELDFWI